MGPSNRGADSAERAPRRNRVEMQSPADVEVDRQLFEIDLDRIGIASPFGEHPRAGCQNTN